MPDLPTGTRTTTGSNCSAKQSIKQKKAKLLPYFRIFDYDGEIVIKAEPCMSEPPASQNNAITRNGTSGLSFPRKRESRSRKGGWMPEFVSNAWASIGPLRVEKGHM
jgi:hypothetical protein